MCLNTEKTVRIGLTRFCHARMKPIQTEEKERKVIFLKSAKIKGLALLLALTMALAVIPVFVSTAASTGSDEPDNWEEVNDLPEKYKTGNLAPSATNIVFSNAPHSDSNWGWDVKAINDQTLNYFYSSENVWVNGGYHTNTGIMGANHSEYVGYDFGEAKTFDTVVVWPCRNNKFSNGTWYMGMPNAFTIDISDDGSAWTTVYTAYAYEVTEAGPQTCQFEEVTARFVRLNALSVNYADGNWAMKISEIGVYDWGYKPTAERQLKNLAREAIVTSNSHHEDGPWHLSYVNDGDRYNMNRGSIAKDYGQFCGYHSLPNGPADAYIVFQLAEASKVNQLVVYPATERYCAGDDSHQENRKDNIHYPSKIEIQLSDDGEQWHTVKTDETQVSEWKPLTYDFPAETASYVRFYMPNLSDNAKISEIEIYDTDTYVDPNAVVERNDVNLAKGKGVIASSVLTPDNSNWALENLNNGIIEEDGGFTTTEGPSAFVGVNLAAKTKFNRLVLYPANPVDERDAGNWSGVPHSFTVEVSDDNISWRKVQTVTIKDVPNGQEPVTVSFPTQAAAYVRINTADLYPKPSDSDKTYIQLAEFER